MKKIFKAVNIIALSISIASFICVVAFLLIFRSSSKVKYQTETIQVEGIEVIKRTANNQNTYYVENINGTIKFYVSLGFEIQNIEQNSVHLTIKNVDKSYIVVINDDGLATVTY